jgi:hypothetical protein
MPQEDDEIQNSYFGGAFTFLLYLIVSSTIIGFLTCVFNFYNFNYSQYYSVVFFYLFLMTCTFILPDRMIGVDPPKTTISSTIGNISSVSGLSGIKFNFGRSKKPKDDTGENKSWFSFSKKSTTPEETDGKPHSWVPSWATNKEDAKAKFKSYLPSWGSKTEKEAGDEVD